VPLEEPGEGHPDLFALAAARPGRAERDLAPHGVHVAHQLVDHPRAGAELAATDPVSEGMDDVAEALGLGGSPLTSGLALQEPPGRA
jgi:hypothetical protein